MGKALYRKYRSRSLDSIVGQDHVTTLLRRAIDTDRVAHAYLFTGPRGVGKTSIARILAHEINSLPYDDDSSHLDIIEIDAASNNSVEDIRELRDKVHLTPTQAQKKIYIIDEVHMLSKPAFNALLKTLEEPPEHVVFILATTDIDKLPDTIVSRTQRHNFKRANVDNIVKNLKSIAKKEKLKITDDALKVIATHSDGSFRDSVSLLDQLTSLSADDVEISASDVEGSLGLASSELITQILEATSSGDVNAISKLLKTAEERGIQPSILSSQLISVITNEPMTYTDLLKRVDDLITVRQSPLPDVKLLTALAKDDLAKSQPATKPHTKASAVAEKMKPSIVELAIKAEEPHPKDDIVLNETNHTSQTTEKPEPQYTSSAETEEPFADFEWTEYVTHAKSQSIALGSVLVKCGGILTESNLTIYCRNEFYKKKIESVRFKQILTSILRDTYGKECEIIATPSHQPPKNSQVASVAAIMGGGEEISL